jgi:predicted DNA-binding transcriptional regulator AlpA
MQMAPLLVRDDTAAALLGVSRATFWRYVKSGIMPQPIKIGGSTRWRTEEIEAAIERQTAEQRDSAA